jgi:cell wall-associated NlpC family hydrolase
MNKICSILLGFVFILITTVVDAKSTHSSTASIPTSQISQFDHDSPAVKKFIAQALDLADLKLTYKFGSANPKAGGMDCSGTIYYLLTSAGVKKPPRDATDLYLWISKYGHFYAVNSHSLQSREFNNLKPGDLLFWEGTYKVHRNPPISHVMLYLGKDKQGNPLMFGSSDGRTYQGVPRHGVSVFDFTLPESTSHTRFVGYGCMPGFNCS